MLYEFLVCCVAKKKLQLTPRAKVTVVLEEDGTIVDEEDFFQQGVEQNDILMILKSGEKWTGEILLIVNVTCASSVLSFEVKSRLSYLCHQIDLCNAIL
jgi:hypothetical protein